MKALFGALSHRESSCIDPDDFHTNILVTITTLATVFMDRTSTT